MSWHPLRKSWKITHQKPFGLVDVHAHVLRAPLVKRRVTEAVFTADLLDRLAAESQ